ncbi:MAG: ferredoxin oxidoreductase [Nitrospinae bacterium]|jgi:pyruvate ferredoxin oxidoreductase alpha subunit|nr:ferredoxin oxidoreductase [Nitrospinota bacterium]MDA1109325.1 ferredoxin oxidoreductase [Nitrospinota bacterium]
MSNLTAQAEGKPVDWVPLGDKQKIVTPEEMFFKLPRETLFITGSEAARESIRRANVDIAISYPITPQSETMQQAGYLYDEGYIKEYYRGEEEIGVFSACAGASRAGVRTLTATAGPGLMRGMEAISSWPGARVPIVLLDMCRVINTPLAIQPDNIEMSFLINTGIILLHAENQQDFYDYPLVAFIVSEKVDVTLPVVVSVDGFFVTHARGQVSITPEEYKLPPRDGWKSAVPAMDNENPPARLSRDAPIQKSNFISYHMHSSWQQEVFAAVERSAKYLRKYLGGLVEIINPEAEDFIIASGSAVSQAREAMRQEAEQGRTVGLIKIKSIRPFPRAELIETLKNAKRILIPEFNQAGWLHKEVCATLYGNCDAIISAGPRVYGGMTMPTEMVLEWLAEARKQNS